MGETFSAMCSCLYFNSPWIHYTYILLELNKLYIQVLPDSSWWLSDTWHKREHRLFYRQAENSSEFDDSAECWIESPKLNYKTQRNIIRWSVGTLSGEFVCYLLPDGVPSCSGYRGGWGGEAAVSMEILYGPTPGRVYGWDLTSSLWLFTIEPEHTNRFCMFLKLRFRVSPAFIQTYVTAYWAKDRYSTRTSRPRFSSLRNSLTHLQRDSLILSHRHRQVIRDTARWS